MSLVKATLCQSGVDYSLLLETIALINTIIRCDGSGNVVKTDPALCILKRLFVDDNTGSGSGVWNDVNVPVIDRVVEGLTQPNLWYDLSEDLYLDESPFTLADGDRRYYCVSANVTMSCFNDLLVKYHNKNCGFGECEWNPTYDITNDHPDCIVSAFNLLGIVADPLADGYNKDKLNFAAVMNKISEYLAVAACGATYCNDAYEGNDPQGSLPPLSDPSLITIHGYCEQYNLVADNWFPVVLVNGVWTVVTEENVDATFRETLENVLKVMKAMCEILKQRIEMDRVLKKSMLTISSCEL